MTAQSLFAFVPPPSVVTEARKYLALAAPPKDCDTAGVLDLAATHKPAALLISAHQKLPADALRKLDPSVRIIATCSVGYDHVDLAVARERGITLTNTPDVLTDCTADFAFMLILTACRRVREGRAVIESGWGRALQLGELLGTQVAGKTLGIYGMGRIGQGVARRAAGFGMRVVYHNRKPLPASKAHGATYCEDLDSLLRQSQILSLHAPATDATRNIIDARAFTLLPPNAVLVNTARGALVDEDALVTALKSGQLFAAGLDVMQHEPTLNAALAALPNAFLTPHMGSATVETRHAMGMRCVNNVHAFLKGGAPSDPVV